MYCRQESVSLLQEARLRYWSLTRLDRMDKPESAAKTVHQIKDKHPLLRRSLNHDTYL